MERKRTFGQEVKALRRRQGWSQKQLAQRLSGVSVRTLGKIERGEKPFVDHKTVSVLADVLNMDGLSRDEFFSLAGLHESSPAEDYVATTTDAETAASFYKSITFPGYIHDSLYYMHSVNSSMLALFGVNIEDYQIAIESPYGPHVLRNFFELQFEARTNLIRDIAWRAHAEMLVYRFRLYTRKFAASQKFVELLNDLKKLPDFKVIWQKIEQNDYAPRYPLLSVFNMRTGEQLQFISAVATDTALVGTEANKVMFIPASDLTRRYLERTASSIHVLLYTL